MPRGRFDPVSRYLRGGSRLFSLMRMGILNLSVTYHSNERAMGLSCMLCAQYPLKIAPHSLWS